MALDARSRSSIYRKLVPVLGEGDANLLMSQFPAVEADELVTKQFLRAELALTREGLRGEMGDLRTELRAEMTELRAEMAELRTELRAEMAELRAEMAELQGRLTVRLGAAIAASTALLASIGIFT